MVWKYQSNESNKIFYKIENEMLIIFLVAIPSGQSSGGQELSLNSVALSHLLGNNPASHQLLNAMQQGQHLQGKASRAHMAPACPVSQQPQLATSPQHGQLHNRHTLLNHYKVFSILKFS